MHPKQQQNLLPLIEVLRYSGAVMVMLVHIQVFSSGWKGVDLFFVISGFVLYHRYIATSGQDESIALYFIRRVSKIYLLYWTAVAAYLLTKDFPYSNDFWKTLVLWPPHRSIMGVSWSLSYELYFYALFGLLLFIKAPRTRQFLGLLLLVIATVITVISMTTVYLKGSLLNFLLGHNVWEFMLGLTAGYLVRRHPVRSGSGSYLLFLVGLLTLCILRLPYLDATSSPVYGLCSFVAVYGAACTSNIRSQAFVKTAGMLGRCSYAIYLFHPLFMPALTQIGLTDPAVQVVLVTGMSIIINRFYEEPLLRIIRRVCRRWLTANTSVQF